ncbi:sugar porter family MFS transporter [Aspergillus affinis]|uniref:sugar porter family MFS transporter n=1 Tax=Aspergillus affinis TaxID=1070780 RepID=UPI0022FDD7A2|nr:sugar transporter [Aspergillus affinis]KAI9040080.1 sugar transporter [Aspergillus affinis]
MGGADTSAAMDAAAQIRKATLRSPSGFAGLVQNRKVFGVAMFACLGGLLYGYNQGVFSGVLVMYSFEEHVQPPNVPIVAFRLITILELGAWFGALYSGILCERISRKNTILLNVGIFCIGVIVQTTAAANDGNSSNILGGRFITGMGVGSLSTSVPMYNAEIAPPEVRGSLVALQQLAITFGIMVSFWINYGTNHIGGTGPGQKDAAWLLPLALQLVPAAILGIGMIFMPFSPRWLVHHDREEEAKKVLTSLRGLPEDDPLLQMEFLEIKAQSLFEKRTEKEKFPHLERTNTWSYVKLEAAGFASLFTSWPMFRRVMVATVTMTFQQWTGVNAVLYYAPSIFAQLGMSNNTTSLLATGVVGIAMFIATIPAVIWIDRLGRKPVLITGAIGMASCHFIIAGIFGQNENQWESHKAAGWAAVAMVWLFVVHFGYSWGPCAWIIIAEIWPLSARAKGTALGASANWMNNFIVGQVTPDMLAGITYGTYIFFGLITFLGALFIAFLVPETKQLSLEEMDVIFGSEGTAVSDYERQVEISREIGLDDALARLAGSNMNVAEVGVKHGEVKD